MSHNPHLTYRPDIDGLRAVAVLSVVVFHAFPSLLPGGFIGVDIFFVISGYLIGGILLKGLSSGTFSFTDFYARRVKRIFPALLTVLIGCYIFGWFALFADEFEQLGKHITGGSAFISNIVLLRESGYFDISAATKPLLHLWSLGVEEQFYIVWPIILCAAWKLRANALAITVIFIGASFYLNLSKIDGDAVWSFYSPFTRFWEILAGSALAYIFIYKKITLGHRSSHLLSTFGFGIVIYGIATITKEYAFPGWWAVVPVAAAAMLIAAGPEAHANKYILSNRAMVWVGLISFPLYLWHWPLLTFARIVESATPSALVQLTMVTASFMLAWATYQFIEKPIRLWWDFHYKTHALVGVMAVIGLVGGLTYATNGLPSRDSVTQYNTINAQFGPENWKYYTDKACLSQYEFKESASYDYWFCKASKNAPPTILLFGNSYANHLYPGLALADEFRNQSILSIGACDPTLVDRQSASEPTNGFPCAGYRPQHQKALIENIVLNSKSIKYILISGIARKPPDEQMIQSLSQSISFFEQHEAKVIVFQPHIFPGYDTKGCFARPFKTAKHDCLIPISEKQSFSREFDPLVDGIKKLHPDVLFFDQNNFMCDGTKCTTKIDNMPVFRDEYHYSEFGSIKLAEEFARWAKTNAPGLIN